MACLTALGGRAPGTEAFASADDFAALQKLALRLHGQVAARPTALEARLAKLDVCGAQPSAGEGGGARA